MNTKIILWLAMSLSFLAYGGYSEEVQLYVVADGEKISGVPKSSIFKSIPDALEEARKLKSEDTGLHVVIHIKEGAYYLESPLEITPELSNLTLKGEGPESVRIKGSRLLKLKWSEYDGDIMVAKVPKDISFDQLVINGHPQILARYPNYDESAKYWQGYAADALSKERIATWEDPKGAFFHALHGGRWGGFHWQVTGVDASGEAILEGGHQNNRGSRPHEEYRMVENVFEELDSPGEWYLDRKENKLYFWPQKEVSLKNATVEVSSLKSLVQVVGTLDNPVHHVTISGIRFEHTRRTLMEDYEPLLRSDWMIYRGSALFFEGTEDCKVTDSEFVHLGGNVLMASSYNTGLTISGNHIHDCGASAVSFIGDPSAVRSPSFNYREYVDLADMDMQPGPKNELYPRECLVENNLIYRIGRVEKQTAGVQVSMAKGITISHNSIYDVPRAGINIGDGTWGGHVLEFNDVFNTVLETSDHGSFNSWGRDRFWLPNRKKMDSITTAHPDLYKLDAVYTTTIRNNRFRCDHGWDIDLDDGSSNYHIYNNLCLNSGIKLREGFERVVENNILVNNSLHPHVWFANSRDVFTNNIVGDAYQDVRLLGWGKELDHNLFPTKEALMKSQIYDRDLNSTYGDPKFKDPANLDFSVKEGSPAFEIGFENFPMDQFGVQIPALKAMAKTPEVPDMSKAKSSRKATPVVAWLRNQLKSVESEQEQSAYGLPTAEGVIVLRIWKPSPAVQGNGLRKGDVILSAGGEKIKNTLDFLTQTKKYQEQGEMQVVVMRNQSPEELQIRLK
ncbi:PDZ domain-containing protein [Marinoscillum furvescens]|uniref:PDZ domain-containing protein n=1 Tax=Marinoscillum furvescens DSM 4134 TaxID=1122208 RepID=A0A3D9L4C2_MARFU|nr:PDZ domain-containing protein [Marinoscillum furvescens]RED98421.1 PDZ domain-containing protein [Marinoscillum furvescens DSM 4134]